ncbi:MAG: sigma-54-dependent transcriptional regulator [Candidatus Oleimicrobiaceae bacterium]
MSELNILIIDDDNEALQALEKGLASERYRLKTVTSLRGGLKILESEEVDIVVTDLKLKDGSGLEMVSYVQEHRPKVAVIVITAYGSVETAVASMRSGAYDYLVKPFRMADLQRLLDRLGETILLRRENERLREKLELSQAAPKLVAVSPRFRKVIELAKQVASSRSTILITGETGTGKELIAATVHYHSPRATKPFVKINCGAIPENLLEAELFGYERGAFTGAIRQKKGKIELADGGSLFLDEIGEITPAMQVKLLRFLQDGEFERLGGTMTLKVDVRIIAATNAELEKKVEEGTFREDLYYRLNVIGIHVPPLRERQEDIPFLVQHFVEKYNALNNKNIQGVEPEVMRQLLRHPWRGNVRELENMVERAVVLAQDKLLRSYHFPALAAAADGSDRNMGVEVGMSFAEIERIALEKTLQYHNYDKQKAARVLQIGLATLYRKIKEYNLDRQ